MYLRIGEGHGRMKKIAVSFLLLMALPVAAYPHTNLLLSEPAENAVLQSPPQKAAIKFLGAAEPALSRLEVFDSKGRRVSKKTRFFEENKAMEVEFSEELKTGEFTVRWLCIGVDGHKTHGSYKFKVK